MSGLDWLWKDEQIEEKDKIKLSEGGDFTPGYTGLWNVAVVWQVWDDSGLDIGEMGIKPDGAQTFSTGSFYYFRNENYDQATQLLSNIGKKFAPKQAWRWELPTTDWIGAPADALEKFGELITQEVRIGGYGGKDKYDFHMITLPSVVQAIAVAAKMIPEQIYDYAKLLASSDEGLGDDYQHRMVGSQDNWEDSELWKARAAIWKALGEENARAYTLDQGNAKHDVTSDKLRVALKILYRPHTQIYARVMRVHHPVVESVNKDGKRLRVMAVTGVWGSKEEAAAAEGAEDTAKVVAPTSTPTDGKKAAAKASTNGAGPKVPERWGNSPVNDWTEWLRDFLSEKGLMGKPKPVVMTALRGIAEDLDSNYLTTPEEIEPWLEKINA